MPNHTLALGLLLTLASCKKDKAIVQPETPVSKTITFHLAQGNDYSSSIYDDVQAEVRLSVTKEFSGTNGAVILWDTTMPYQSLRSYPSLQNPLTITKQFNGILQSRERIRFGTAIRYVDKLKQKSMVATGEDIPSAVSNRSVPVHL